MPKPRLLLIPGLGVNHRLFHHQRAAFPDLIVPDWIDPIPRETLAAYAKRLASTITHDGPLVVGGVSFGGMLALEMARHLNAKNIVLIASSRSATPIRPLLRCAERCARSIPSALIASSMFLAPAVLGRGGGVPKAERALLAEMVRDVSIPLLRWGARAIMEWPGCSDPPAPVRHIHGDRDWVIPHTRLAPAPDLLIRGGPHVLNLSHPREINAYLAETLAM